MGSPLMQQHKQNASSHFICAHWRTGDWSFPLSPEVSTLPSPPPFPAPAPAPSLLPLLFWLWSHHGRQPRDGGGENWSNFLMLAALNERLAVFRKDSEEQGILVQYVLYLLPNSLLMSARAVACSWHPMPPRSSAN
eukprot:763340-Hanusia_phi.AAC.8